MSPQPFSLAAGAGEVTNLYSVSYNTNNSTGGTTPPTQSAESSSDNYNFTIPTVVDLTKTDYLFTGWSLSPDSSTAEYEPGSTITLAKDSPNITLYTVWLSTTLTDWNTLQYMQQMNPAACANGTETGKQLIDVRDGKSYWVAKLKDGNCWMTQNLDYDDPDGQKRVGSSKPDSWSIQEETRQYWDPGEKIVSGSKLINAPISTDRHLLIGNYYSWVSATNGSGANIISTNNSDYPIDAPDSICPEGWKLPLSGNDNSLSDTAASGSFGLMIKKQLNITNTGTGDSKLLIKPLYFIHGGRLETGSSIISIGDRGDYWSSTASSSTNAYGLYFYSSNVNPSYNANRFYGYSVRCVAR